MSTWFYKVTQDLTELPNCIVWYEAQLAEARLEIKLRGNLEQHSRELPGIFEYRFNQLQEIEAILEHLNIDLRKLRSEKFKKFIEHYNRALTSRDAEKYVDSDSEVVSLSKLVNEFSLLRNKYLGLIKALDTKQWQVTNIVKLRVAGMDDATMG
jgi:DNA repair exonuclease SbcCD ATPase subunit